MRRMIKRVNIKAPVAIKTITPPIYGTLRNIEMTTSDILKCLCRRAIVEEILDDGSTIRLSMSNYYLDNNKPVPVAPSAPEKKPTVVEVRTNDKACVIVDENEIAPLDDEKIDEPKEYSEVESESTEEEVETPEESEAESETEFVTGMSGVKEESSEASEPVATTTTATSNTNNNQNNNYNHKKKKHK